MELVLPVVTALSLGLALVLGIAVVRLSRAERNRSAARIAALSAAAAEPEPARENRSANGGRVSLRTRRCRQGAACRPLGVGACIGVLGVVAHGSNLAGTPLDRG